MMDPYTEFKENNLCKAYGVKYLFQLMKQMLALRNFKPWLFLLCHAPK